MKNCYKSEHQQLRLKLALKSAWTEYLDEADLFFIVLLSSLELILREGRNSRLESAYEPAHFVAGYFLVALG